MNSSKVCRIVARSLGIYYKDVSPDSKLLDELGCDFQDRVWIAEGLEQEFQCRITTEDLKQAVTVSDLISLVSKEK